TPSDLNLAMVDKRLKAVKGPTLTVISHIKQVQMDVQVWLKGLCCFPNMDGVKAPELG
ncbi:unnamed protein product, partial [marine sediment metagenome]